MDSGNAFTITGFKYIIIAPFHFNCGTMEEGKYISFFHGQWHYALSLNPSDAQATIEENNGIY